jgi:two-component system LytT family response regulator
MRCWHAETEHDRHSENGELAVTKEELEENGHQASVIASTSAHDEYTTFAIETSTVDHALKSSRAVRSRRALDAAFRCTAEECAAGSSDAPPQRQSSKIAIKAKGKIVFLDPVEVIVVEAEGNYVSLRHRSDSYWLRESISVMAEILKPYGFIRIHRSVLVNSLFVEQIKSLPSGAYGLRTTGGKEYKVTRTYKNNLKSLAAAWIGTDIFLNQ